MGFLLVNGVSKHGVSRYPPNLANHHILRYSKSPNESRVCPISDTSTDVYTNKTGGGNQLLDAPNKVGPYGDCLAPIYTV